MSLFIWHSIKCKLVYGDRKWQVSGSGCRGRGRLLNNKGTFLRMVEVFCILIMALFPYIYWPKYNELCT